MKSSLLEVIDMVLERLEGAVQTAENESSIRVWLAGQGYSRRDIDAAMRIVFPQGGEAAAPRPRRVRVAYLRTRADRHDLE